MSRPPEHQGADLDPVRRRPAVPGELLLLTACFAVFSVLHAAAVRVVASAAGNALAVQSAERATRLDVEIAMNGWLADHAALTTAAVYVYRSYYVVVVGVLAWAFVRHPDVYVPVRRTLVAMFFLVLPVYWGYPLSPPRFALPGVVDLVAAHDPLGSSGGHGANTLSAMPSMHVALSAWCAWAVWSTLRGSHPRLALLAWLFPAAMTAVVLTTGNHYVLDVVGSAVLLVASVAAATLWGQRVDRRLDLSAAAATPPRRPALPRRP